MLFTERGRGLTEEKPLARLFPMYGCAPALLSRMRHRQRRWGSAEEAGRGMAVTSLRPRPGFAGQKSTVDRIGLSRAVPGLLPGTPVAAYPGSSGFCRKGGTQVGHGHQHMALGMRQGVGNLPSRGQGESSIALKGNSSLPFSSISLLTAQSKY